MEPILLSAYSVHNYFPRKIFCFQLPSKGGGFQFVCKPRNVFYGEICFTTLSVAMYDNVQDRNIDSVSLQLVWNDKSYFLQPTYFSFRYKCVKKPLSE